jgi:hypothetical protein
MLAVITQSLSGAAWKTWRGSCPLVRAGQPHSQGQVSQRDAAWATEELYRIHALPGPIRYEVAHGDPSAICERPFAAKVN